MEFLRTPDECFNGLPGYDFAPNYLEVDDTEGGTLRVHYLDEGDPLGPVVLLLHGEPTWSFLYRKMIPIIADAGFRVIAPDLVGFGRSDKPVKTTDYTYARHVAWMLEVLIQLKLSDIHLICQDWGGLIGLRLVGEHPELFAKVLAANTLLPTGEEKPTEAFLSWQRFSQEANPLPIGMIVTQGKMGEDVMQGYDAPYPDESYKAGARIFPMLVPATPDVPGVVENKAAWKVLNKFKKPFLTVFGGDDPFTAHGAQQMRKQIPGCKGQSHKVLPGIGHFIQEEAGEALAEEAVTFFSR